MNSSPTFGVKSSQPNFKIAQSTPSTMPLPHNMSYGNFNNNSLKVTSAPVSKQNSDMAAHLKTMYGPTGPKSFGGKGWGGP